MESNYRQASHSGTWYSSDPTKLKQDLRNFLDNAERNPESELVKSIIVPHAGYRYSGATAGWSYVNIDPAKFSRVVLLGPSHSAYIPGIGIPTCTKYETPLGDISLDLDELKILSKCEGFYQISLEADETEHSLEMQFPFLRYIFGEKDFKLLPLMVGQTTLDQDRKFAKILAEYYSDKETLFVISSDFCHWGDRFKFTYHESTKYKFIFESIESLDRMGMDSIERISADNFNKYLVEYKNTICGRRPISILICIIEEYLKADKLKNSIRFVKYDQSSKVKDMADSSVSYAAGINIVIN